jgi:hypothetical protein
MEECIHLNEEYQMLLCRLCTDYLDDIGVPSPSNHCCASPSLVLLSCPHSVFDSLSDLSDLRLVAVIVARSGDIYHAEKVLSTG